MAAKIDALRAAYIESLGADENIPIRLLRAGLGRGRSVYRMGVWRALF